MSMQPRYGVLLVNTGTPAAPTKREIKRFLGHFLMNRRIAPKHRILWWILLHGRILPSRVKRNVARYEAIWTDEGNPFTVAHDKIVRGLGVVLAQNYGDNILVTCGFTHSAPDVLDALRFLQEAKCDRVIVLPLYPQSAYSTTGSVYDAVERATSKLAWSVECRLIDNYYDESVYIRAIAASIKHAGFNPTSDDRLLFSLHSIPLSDIENGDTYELQTSSSCLAIARELGLDRKRWTIGYQCRFDQGREWLKPYTSDVLDRWARVGNGRVFVVCPGFAVDCLETLYDVFIDHKPYYVEARRMAGKRVVEDDFIYVPCLDRSKAHVTVLKSILSSYFQETHDGEF